MQRYSPLILGAIGGAIALTAFLAEQGRGQQPTIADGPRYTSDGRMMLPAHYREWVFLSSGLGMTYGPAGRTDAAGNPRFDNVFASPSAYKSFLRTGKWPDKTILMLEVRNSASNLSINTSGHVQTDFLGVEAHVKDAARFPGGWAFFGFAKSNTAAIIPHSANCYSCHSEHGAVDTTFVQFYPTLLEAAQHNSRYRE
ncbi:MAG TPA: cytochrome P460 family protein [Bryobacteraceae bacterium]|nr:cytochrome P460 family protein [Bryobacteraceae bacterium]